MGMTKRTYSITDNNDDWVKVRVGSGEYATDSEYMRDLIRRDKEQFGKIEALCAAIIEGEQSGMSNRTPQQIVEAAKQRLREDGKL